MRRLALLLVALFIASVPQLEAASPNVVLIFVDDMGYGDIGPFGNTKVRTPNLDQFAKEGMKFTSFYATPVCSMSRACLASPFWRVSSTPSARSPWRIFGPSPRTCAATETAFSIPCARLE